MASLHDIGRAVTVAFLCLVPPYPVHAHDGVHIIDGSRQGSSPQHLLPVGDFLYFAADDGITGRELWKLDQQGMASPVADLIPGAASSNPTHFAAAGPILYFFALHQDRHGTRSQLWATTGSFRGTRPLSGAVPGIPPTDLHPLGQRVFFVHDTAGQGRELWVADYHAGTVDLFREFRPGDADGLLLGGMIACGDRILFAAWSPEHDGREILWKMDGTPEGTVPIHDSDGNVIPCAWYLSAVIDTDAVYLVTYDNACSVWKADRAFERVELLHSGSAPNSFFAEQLAMGSNGLYFQGATPERGQELWRSDGTPEGTILVKDIRPGPANSAPYFIRPVPRGAVFVAEDDDHGAELWTTDGTEEGTHILIDMMPGPTRADPYQLFNYKDMVLFSAEHDRYGEELWRTDGTPEGTSLVCDINPGIDASEPYYLKEFAGRVYFTAIHPEYGTEIWSSDGTAEQTVPAVRINPAVRNVLSSSPAEFTVFNGLLYFAATGPDTGRELWRTDGTEAGTIPVADIAPGRASSDPHDLVVHEGNLFFRTRDAQFQARVWRTDGTPDGTIESDAYPAIRRPTLDELLPTEVYHQLVRGPVADDEWLVVDTGVYFQGTTRAEGSEPWYYDSAAGTATLVADIHPGSPSSDPGRFLHVGNSVVFRAYSPNHGAVAWICTTPGGAPAMLPDGIPGPTSSAPDEFVAWGDRVVWTCLAQSRSRTIFSYRTGPTTQSFSLENLELGQLGFAPRELTLYNDLLYFVSPHDAYGEELWCTDGENPPSYWLVKDIMPTVAFDPVAKVWR